MAKADVACAVKEAARRNSLVNLARVELGKKDLAAAKAGPVATTRTRYSSSVAFRM